MLSERLKDIARHDPDTALERASTDTERIEVLLFAGCRDAAVNLAQSLLAAQTHDEVSPNSEAVTVYAGPFVGHHQIIETRHGGYRPATIGSYIHEPTDLTFESEAPDDDDLRDRVCEYLDVEPRGHAARAEYRRSRL